MKRTPLVSPFTEPGFPCPRRGRSRHVLLASLLALGAVACGGDDGAGGGRSSDGGAPLDASTSGSTDAGDSGTDTGAGPGDAGADAATTPPDSGVTGVDVSGQAGDEARAAARAICEKLAACCSPSDYEAYVGQFKGAPYDLKATPAAADCVDTLARELGVLRGKWVPAVKRGTMAYDAARDAACVARVHAAACGAALSTAIYDARCFGVRGSEVFRRIAKVGDACVDIGDSTFYGECDPALGYCGSSKTCEAWRRTGDACGVVPTRQFCAPELSCDGGGPQTPGKCSPPPVTVPAGGACDAQTGAIQLCPAGQYCSFDTGRCEDTKADGTSCAGDDECKDYRPFSCYPFGKGTCGSRSFCGGEAAASDGGAPDAKADTGTAGSFTIRRDDDAASVAASAVTDAQRGRVRLAWKVSGATTAALDGAGDLVAVERAGTPSWDDLASVPGVAAGSAPVRAQMPFTFTLLGDTWRKDLAISINRRGVVTRGGTTSATILDPALPIPARGLSVPPVDWADGTIAPFLDAHLEPRDAASRIKSTTLGSGADHRFVIEWSGLVTGVDTRPRIAIGLTFQVALYEDGRVELRYAKRDAAPQTSPLDEAILRGQGAIIGLADASGTKVVPISLHRASIPAGGLTYALYPSGSLPSEGEAVVVLPESPGARTFTLRAAGGADLAVVADVRATYTVKTTTGVVRDITLEGATPLVFDADSVVGVDVPFTLDVLREGWRGLSVSRTGAVGPWGMSSIAVASGLGGDPNPLPKRVSPNGFLPVFYGMGVSAPAWCSTAPTPAYALVEPGATPRRVTVLWKQIYRCGAAGSANRLDAEVVLFENGDVEYVYGNHTSHDPSITGSGVLAGLESANGDVAFVVARDTAGALENGVRVVLTRTP